MHEALGSIPSTPWEGAGKGLVGKKSESKEKKGDSEAWRKDE